MPGKIIASNKAVVVAAPRIVSIKAGDGRIVITPSLARSLARKLEHFANVAETSNSGPPENTLLLPTPKTPLFQ